LTACSSSGNIAPMKKPSKHFPKPDLDDGRIHLCECLHPYTKHAKGGGKCIAATPLPGIGNEVCACKKFTKKKKRRAV
jgi:hypothetical protein